jgi:hypothetical protein
VTRNRLLASLVVLAVGTLFGGTPAAAQCSPGGCSIGPCIYSNLLYDHRFESPSCGAWGFIGHTSRLWEADTCSSGFSGYGAVFYGSDTGGVGGAVYQDIQIPSTQSSAEIGFYLDIQGSSASWWDRLTVTLRDPSTDQVLETLVTATGNGSSGCHFIRADVSGDYSDQTVRLQFESTIWSGASTRFVIDDVNYWHFF